MEHHQKQPLELKVFNIIFTLLVGLSCVIGQFNIPLSGLMGIMAISMILRGGDRADSAANLYFVAIFVSYYAYFTYRAEANNFNSRATAVFVENIPFLLAALSVPFIKHVSADRILKFAGDWLLPMSLVLFASTAYEHYMMDIDRVIFSSRSPLILAALIVASINLALFEWKSRGAYWRVSAVLCWVIGLIVIGVFTQSRASLGIHFFGAAIVACYVIWDNNLPTVKNLMRIFFVGVAGLIVIVIFSAVIYKLNIVPRLNLNIDYILGTKAQEMDYSTASRVKMWELGIEQFWKAPLEGVGPQNTFLSIVAKWPFETKHGHLHSDVLNHLVGGGIIGILLYLMVATSPLFFLLANKVRDNKTIFICIFVVFIIIATGFTARVFLRPVMISWAVNLILFCLVMTDNYHQRKPKTTD